MAQSDIIIENKNDAQNSIVSTSEKSGNAAVILKSYLDKSFLAPFLISDKIKENESQIILAINDDESPIDNSFTIESDERNIRLTAANEKTMRYAVYTLLENWGFRKFTAKETYIPKLKKITFPKNTRHLHQPSFEYRALFYPDAFDEAFRDWHKLDWHPDDFGIWGHSFEKLLPAKENFEKNPVFFALYENQRRPESLCMTNDTVVDLVATAMQKIINENPEATFYSISQNDDIIYCECQECKKTNMKFGGPQGSHYTFLNKIALRFPKTRITTLAYLHTYNPPADLKIEPNIYTLFCPIGLNRGKPLTEDTQFQNDLQNWSRTASHLYLWDYTVSFSNYMLPFPNIATFSRNYKLFKENNVKGLFVQGFADVPGDFSELRQYLLAKLLWNTEIDIEATIDDFLRGFYGKAAPFIRKYLNLLNENQSRNGRFLDIYTGPVQNRNSFLTPEAMDKYDRLITKAELSVNNDIDLKNKILKIRMSLEFVYFEQSKFYGKDLHGMFTINKEGKKEVKKGLTERVRTFAKNCNRFGIYELSEGGLSPDEYYQEWLAIAKNTTTHLGENIDVDFINPPTDDFKGKGGYGLVDGNKGYKDFNINWIGWYGTNPEIELVTNNLEFNHLKISFLDDQRHWIFIPEKITVYGFSNENWTIIKENKFESLTENYSIKAKHWELYDKSFSRFTKIKIVIKNQEDLPSWRKRKSKKPMVMIDEIELFTN